MGTRKGSPPGGKAKLGYVEYDIRQTNKLEENEIEVQVAKKTGQESSVKMINVAWWNCFRSNPSVWLKLNKGLIVGVMTKDDWIIMAKKFDLDQHKGNMQRPCDVGRLLIFSEGFSVIILSAVW